jgi:response regulator RpfG family c-di-GMP phosphodiesterase
MNLSDPTSKPTILVVDDTPDNLTLMSELAYYHHEKWDVAG